MIAYSPRLAKTTSNLWGTTRAVPPVFRCLSSRPDAFSEQTPSPVAVAGPGQRHLLRPTPNADLRGSNCKIVVRSLTPTDTIDRNQLKPPAQPTAEECRHASESNH